MSPVHPNGSDAAPLVRPMRAGDVEEAERLSAASFHEVDVRTTEPGLPVPVARHGERSRRWVERTRHLLRTDPGGCWVAEDPRGLAGVATSMTRELMWLLSTYAVRPDVQGRGTGRALLDAALHHGRGCVRGMLAASGDPAAVRRYRVAGFDLHPQMVLRGRVDRAALPAVRGVREATAADTDLMDSLDRRTRGAAHGPDHAVLQGSRRGLVCESRSGAGYAYLGADGAVSVLAATDRRTAARLLWTALADAPPEAVQEVHHVTAANQWALDVAVAARLQVGTSGYLAVRGMRPPAPYLHDGGLL